MVSPRQSARIISTHSFKRALRSFFFGPAVAGYVFVHKLAAAYGYPEFSGFHFAKRGYGLRNYGRMVALAGGVYDAEFEVGGLHGGAEPAPGKTAFALVFAPGVKMIGGKGVGKAGFLRLLHQF